MIAATALAAVGGVTGMWTVHKGTRSRWTVVWMSLAFFAQLGFLSVRGEARGACPLVGLGEILVFLAWSLMLFYLAVGPTYRLSLLGVFTAPLVAIIQILALLPGVWVSDPHWVGVTDGWRETHAAMSVLSYGALALAGVAGVMFLVLDKQLKDHHLQSGLFRNLPPVRELLKSMVRLLWIGLVLLSVGVVAGFMMPHTGGTAHLVAATVVWLAYAALLVIRQVRGLTGRKTATVAVVLFIVSLSVFALV
ncbi:cytochrome c biogenesis protein [Luteolibacter flavescens]|uniref:Cytochrome c biogenesis protein n=1 Tax=Luteolibacter flavescens TaxID=1859460 RepID=A0ABT3FQB1_9BACT|nr:cytochrome c biogenesis protein [Luteolibacter flavescens]MCW1885776.1 cytochrome c biogenesis protein [Luteolibacter flavescens]